MRWTREASLSLALIALLVVAALLEPRFVTVRTQALLAPHSWELAIVAVPMLLIVVSGGIDLSVGATLALSAVTLGLLHEQGVPVGLAALGAISVGTIAGALNGVLIARTRVHPLLVTLATMAAFRGVAEGVSLARPLSGYPEGLLRLGEGQGAGIAFALVALLTHLLLTRHRVGRWIYAMGSDEQVSRYSKTPVDRIKLGLYTLSGGACGLAAVFMVARNNTAKADLGMGLELEAITAVVLGGASIEGGRGRVIGLLLGLALIHEARQFSSWHWKQSEINLLVMGGLLIGALLLDRLPSLITKWRPSRKMDARS